MSELVEKLLNDSATATKIRSSLVNVDVCADVTFTFPSHSETYDARNSIKAHKVFLISASSVFYTMFCGSLPPPTNEVAIEDICRHDFMEVLRHIYGAEATISFENVYGIWYSAQKYLLAELSKQCVAFVRKGTTSSNVLDVFNSVQLFDNREVDQECLNLLLDCPHQYFEANGIETMNKDAFRKLMLRPGINCSIEFLEAIALKWLNAQKKTEFCCFSEKVKQIFKDEFRIQPMDFEKKRTTPSLEFNHFDNIVYAEMELDRVEVEIPRSLSFELYGIGIYVGIDPEYNAAVVNSEWVCLKIQRDTDLLLKKMILVRQEFTPSILRVMFEKIQIDGEFSITIKFPVERFRAINPLSFDKKSMGRMTLPAERTCIAYFIEKEI